MHVATMLEMLSRRDALVLFHAAPFLGKIATVRLEGVAPSGSRPGSSWCC